MRLLFARHRGPPGLPEDGVERAAVDLLGPAHVDALRAFFDRSLRSVEELDLASALSAVGLRPVVRAAAGADDKGSVGEALAAASEESARGWLGAALRERGGALEVQSVVEGSPAQRAGLAAGDEIVALDGFRADLRARLGRAPPQQQIRLSVFRMDELSEFRLVPSPAPRDTLSIVADPAAGEREKALRAQWLGGAFPGDDKASA
jgi:predicted metalloprotease with PDZ domain